MVIRIRVSLQHGLRVFVVSFQFQTFFFLFLSFFGLLFSSTSLLLFSQSDLFLPLSFFFLEPGFFLTIQIKSIDSSLCHYNLFGKDIYFLIAHHKINIKFQTTNYLQSIQMFTGWALFFILYYEGCFILDCKLQQEDHKKVSTMKKAISIFVVQFIITSPLEFLNYIPFMTYYTFKTAYFILLDFLQHLIFKVSFLMITFYLVFSVSFILYNYMRSVSLLEEKKWIASSMKCFQEYQQKKQEISKFCSISYYYKLKYLTKVSISVHHIVLNAQDHCMKVMTIQKIKQSNNKTVYVTPPFIRMSTLLSKDSTNAKKTRKQIEKDQPSIIDPAEDEKSRSESFHSQTRDNKADGNNNTLGSLTKKFVQLIKAAPNQIIEIQQASQRLDIQKRRIYDITNVLEGIGYIQKLGKNLMKWVGGQQGTELQMQVKKLQQKSQKLEMQMFNVEQQIAELKNELLNLSNQNTYLNYFIKEDIILIMKALKVKSILLFIGGNGDQLQILSNPEKKTSQWTIQSGSTLSKLFHCKLNQDSNIIQITQNPTFYNKLALKEKETKTKQIIQDKRQQFSKAADQDAQRQTKMLYQHQFLDYEMMLSSALNQQEKQSQYSEDKVLNLQRQ